MASGDKLIDALSLDPKTASQGTDLFSPTLSGYTFQGLLKLAGTTSGTPPLSVAAEVKMASTTEAGVPDFDVEKQYKLTIEEV